MGSLQLSFNTRKSLCNQLGDAAGNEVADILQEFRSRLDSIERDKIDVIPIVPRASAERVPLARKG
ncbi:MAG: hypothetical protein ACYC0X_02940 [Pirellulaceae bacterium]